MRFKIINPFKWRIVTDGEIFAVRRRTYFFCLFWVYKSRFGNNFSDKPSVNIFCWTTKEGAINILNKSYKREITDYEI